MQEHPDLLALDAIRAGEENPEAAAHVQSCDACRATVEKMRKLAGDLALPKIEIPAGVDRAVKAIPRPKVLRWAATAAAALLFGVLVMHYLPRASESKDLTRDGKVDVVDAYQLALRVRQGRELPAELDLNGDGEVDWGDVDQLGREIVSIRKEGS